MTSRRDRHRKGPLAGPFSVPAAAVVPGVCAATAAAQTLPADGALLPSALVSLAATTVGLLAAWWVILRLSRRKPRRLFAAALAGFFTGNLLALAPLARWGAETALAAQVSLYGAAIAGLAILATGVILVWTLFAALIDRL